MPTGYSFVAYPLSGTNELLVYTEHSVSSRHACYVLQPILVSNSYVYCSFYKFDGATAFLCRDRNLTLRNSYYVRATIFYKLCVYLEIC